MNNIWTIVKKELKRVFSDYRVIFSLFVLPPLTIILIYGLIGLSAKNENDKTIEYNPNIVVVNSPTEVGNNNDDFKVFLAGIEGLKGTITYLDDLTTEEIEAYSEKIRNREIDLMLVFPIDFSEKVNLAGVPLVHAYYNINKTYSGNEYQKFTGYLWLFEQKLAGLDEEGIFEPIEMRIGDEAKAKGSIIGMILPMLIVIYLMAGALSVGIESIAGEKERGTIATLLITPIKRSHIVIGKIISTSILGLLSSLTSFLGIIAILPTFAQMSGEEVSTGSALGGLLGGYNIVHVFMLLAVMVVATLMFVAIVILTSTYAKSIKEASTLIMPIYLVVIGAAMFTMFSEVVSQEIVTYLIPIYNIVIALKAILSFDMTSINFLVMLLSTLFYTIAIIYITQKMFRNERVMFK
jgi:sodium transport system permease protein